jgi:mRNA interferase HicA
VKRNDLVKKLEDGGFIFERHGGSHDIYIKGNVKETIPRHKEINERLAKAILKRNGLL